MCISDTVSRVKPTAKRHGTSRQVRHSRADFYRAGLAAVMSTAGMGSTYRASAPSPMA